MILLLGGFIEIHTGHTLWELMGHINSAQPLVLTYNGGYIIVQAKKLEYASWRSTLHVEILPRHGELESCLAAGPLTWEIIE